MDTRTVLDEVFALDVVGPDTFAAVVPPTDGARAFGGHLLGLALRAAAATVAESSAAVPHSAHARFVAAGRPLAPVRITVDRVRDGRSIRLRHVTVIDEEDHTLFVAEMSFHRAGGGEEWQCPMAVSRVPPCPVPTPLASATPLAFFEVRAEHAHERGGPARLHPYWARTRKRLPDDPVLHACALAVLTDIGVSGTARRPGMPLRVQRAAVSLDHALWVHRPFRADDWLRVEAVPIINAHGRGFARGTVSTARGLLVASFAQEALLREP